MKGREDERKRERKEERERKASELSFSPTFSFSLGLWWLSESPGGVYFWRLAAMQDPLPQTIRVPYSNKPPIITVEPSIHRDQQKLGELQYSE